MSEAGRWLAELRSVARLVALYPDDHPSVDVSLLRLVESGSALASSQEGEAVVSVVGDSIYLGRNVLPHESLEHNALLRDLQARGIDTVSLFGPTARADALEFALFLSGRSPDLPAGRSIRLNERPFGFGTLEGGDDSAGSSAPLRQTYVRGLDVLRGTARALAAEQRFDLTGAAWVVESLVEQAVAQPSASILLSSMKSHDEYTFYHSVNVCILSIALGRLIGMDDEPLRVMAIGGLLHDIGKVRVPIETLQYPGRLDTRRWAEIKLHPQEGAAAILAAAQPGQEMAAVVALEHHARYDGQGYPQLRSAAEGSAIHFFSRLVSTADTYDALTTRRSYRRAETPVGALEILLQAAGGRYDPDMVQAFIRLVGLYPVGSILETNDGSQFLVTAAQDDPGAPILGLLVRTADGTRLDDPEPIALMPGAVARQLTAAQAGLDPASLLEQASIAWGET